jgi:hypothetical protein
MELVRCILADRNRCYIAYSTIHITLQNVKICFPCISLNMHYIELFVLNDIYILLRVEFSSICRFIKRYGTWFVLLVKRGGTGVRNLLRPGSPREVLVQAKFNRNPLHNNYKGQRISC